MTWKAISVIGERCRLVVALLRKTKSVSQICREERISRKTAYKWLQRFGARGRAGLRDRSRRPRRRPRQTSRQWVERIRRLRQRRRFWGPKKLRVALRERWGPGVPGVRTIGRWLQRLGMARVGRRRARRACVVVRPVPRLARRANEVWTVDFKGWFRTGDGQRVEPLTVRDLYSRLVLVVRLLSAQDWRQTRREFIRLFRQRGLPERIRVDNGSPFGSTGPAGLSRLSAWWVRLGIQVEFIRPGHPEDNGAHEQFHRVLKQETTRPAARTVRGQQHRMSGWCVGYNQERPHEALRQARPWERYRPSRRRYPRKLPTVAYGQGWAVRQGRQNGEIKWQGRRRFIGEAFVGQPIGLKRLRAGVWVVHFCGLLIGHLHAADVGAMRPAVYRHRKRGVPKAGRGKR
jgi:putative transposase